MTGRTSAASSGKRPNSPAKRGQSAARRSTNNSMSTSDSLDLRQVLSSARLTFESEMKKPKTKQQLLPSPSIGISKRLSSPPSSSGNQTRSNSAPVSPVKLLDSSSAQKRKATRENVSPRGSGSRSAAGNAATTAAVTSPKRIKSEPLETNSKRTCPPVSAIVSVKQIRSEQSETSSKRAPSPIETSRPKKKQFELKKLYQDEGVIHLLHSLPTSRRKIQTNHFNPTLKTLGGSSAAPAGSSGHKALQNRTNSPIPSHQTRPTFTHLQQKEPKKNHLLRVNPRELKSVNPESLMNPQTLELLKKLPKKEYLHLWSSTSRYKLSDSTMEAAQAANAAAEAAAAAISNARQTSSVSPADSTSESDISSASMLQLKRPRIGSRMLMCVSTITKQYKDIVIRSYPNFTQIIVSPTTTGMRHTYNVNVFEEIIDAMRLLMEDSHCKAVMMTGLGRTYSQGVDLTLLTFESVEKQKKSAEHLAHGIRKFVQYLLGYKKLLVAAVNGHAHGLGVTLLPLFDIVYANDKALFTTDYAKIGQIPEAFASVTMAGTGHHSLSEMFLLGRVLTAQEAKDKGLVSAVVWPDKFLEEIVPRIEVLETQVDTKGMEAIKMLMKSRTKRQIAEIADEETKMLVANWTAPDFAKKARQYLKANEQIIFQ